MCRVKCEIENGLVPTEKVARITTKEGRKEEVAVYQGLVEEQEGFLTASEIGREGSHVLIELPGETASGHWRLWVNESDISFSPEASRP